jgi:acetyl esterase/lipase
LPSRRVTLSLPFLAPLAACSPLGIINGLLPKDAGSERAASDLAYGPLPRQRFDIYVPEGLAPDAAAPTLMFIYGGGWNRGDKDNYVFAGRAFAAAGFVTAVPDYRVVPDARYPDFVIDCALALAAFQKVAPDYGGRTGPVFVAGHSAGAYNAVMLGLASELLEPAGLTFDDIAGIAGISGPYDFLPLRVKDTRAAFGGYEDLPATQPVNRAHGAAPPMLLVNGSDDEIVSPKNVHRLQAELEAAGGTAVTQEYEGMGHVAPLLAISRPFRKQGGVLDDVITFFKSIDDGTPLAA